MIPFVLMSSYLLLLILVAPQYEAPVSACFSSSLISLYQSRAFEYNFCLFCLFLKLKKATSVLFRRRALLCGGSTGLFIYGYCWYYYYARSDMSGFMQTSFFFGYMACICYGFFLMLGTVGFRAALFFVRHIYRSIKCE